MNPRLKVSLFSTVLISLLSVSGLVFAKTMTEILCAGYGVFNGPIGQALAIFAVVALGIGLFLGKITWGLVFAIAIGIGAIFGAPQIVGAITGDTGVCANDQTTGNV